MKVATVQMPIADGACDVNRNTLEEILINSSGADIYLVPELWTSGYGVEQWRAIAKKDTPDTLCWMSNQAKKRKIWLGGSVIAENENGGICNRFVMFNRNGELVVHYDKIHRFLPMGEDALDYGLCLPPIFEIEGMRVAPAICYDLRFPEMFRRLALNKVDLFLVPSEWPCPRQEPLAVLAGARAIENQAYVALANRTAYDSKGQKFCGSSGLYGPFGKTEVFGQDDIGAVCVDLNLSDLDSARRTLQVFEERIQGVDYD